MLNAPDDLPPCAGCGSCCHLVVELAPGVDDVPGEFVVEHDGLRCMDQRGDGACVALDPVSRLCTIYERRPKTCRDFMRGESLCRKAVARFVPALRENRGTPS
jgi:Fe-S-cluster containining protein